MPELDPTAGLGVSLLRIAAIKARTGLSRTAIYRLIASHQFPAPIHIAGTRNSLWPSTVIDKWIGDALRENK